MLVLTFVTGVVDAVGYLGLDRVFTGNMTGNIVILGMGVAGADELPVLGPAIALLAFTLGALGAGMVLRRAAAAWTTRVTALLAAGGAMLGVLAVALWVLDDGYTPDEQLVIAAGTALAMGSQACVARKLAIKDMTTVVVTSTLTSWASESLVTGWRGAIWNRRLGALVLILLGAVVGALLLQVHMSVAMAVASVLTLGVTAVGHRALR